jgi:hypothetical protein
MVVHCGRVLAPAGVLAYRTACVYVQDVVGDDSVGKTAVGPVGIAGYRAAR